MWFEVLDSVVLGRGLSRILEKLGVEGQPGEFLGMQGTPHRDVVEAWGPGAAYTCAAASLLQLTDLGLHDYDFTTTMTNSTKKISINPANPKPTPYPQPQQPAWKARQGGW